MKKFIHEDFLLATKAARNLYHKYAAAEPIFDYHCHIPPKDIAENRQFNNLFEIWLEGDHYKWRAMRSNGVAEKYCTGNATPEEKFKAWAATVRLELRPIDARIVLCLHDELLVHVPGDRADDAVGVLRAALDRTAGWWFPGGRTRFVAQITAGRRWVDAKS